jgi:pre-mRNA-splicing factor CWC26
MPSNLSDYLAKNYLVADPKPSKKRKRKDKDAPASGLIIADDDDSSWATPKTATDDGPDGPVTVSGTSAEFRRAKKSNWKTLGGPSTSAPPPNDADAAAADAVLASVAAESRAAQALDDEMPAVDDSSVAKMTDGTHAGLQSAAAVSAQLARRKAQEDAEFARHRRDNKEEETVYRDATGRRVDLSMRRAEARRAAAEAEERERERQAKIAPKGDVQAAQAKARREALEDAKTMSFARTADDEEMNRELKEKERWNDPMAQFLTPAAEPSGGGKASTGKKGKARRPIYAGAAPPNRYGIKPGYRWDGVDRGTGFEAERFKAINRRDRNKGLDYAWQMDE